MAQRIQLQTLRKTKRIQDLVWTIERNSVREQHHFGTKDQARACIEDWTAGLALHATQLTKANPLINQYKLIVTGGTVARAVVQGSPAYESSSWAQGDRDFAWIGPINSTVSGLLVDTYNQALRSNPRIHVVSDIALRPLR